MTIYERELKEYTDLNRIAKSDSVVVFGSSFAKNIPVSELDISYDMDSYIYNRSITDLSVFDACDVIETCIYNIQPSKILIQLGETDLARGFKVIPEIVTEYNKVIRKIRDNAPNAEIVVLSVCSTDVEIYPEQLNKALSVMSSYLKCKFVDITASSNHESPYIRAFEILKPYIRKDNISFFDAMNMAHI
ncbi:MAG: hypothetical protein PUF08_06645 [Clostridiales bacterium]|nr:hypothetical protein [Clostridiales bacterium]